jgi:hypothetical protein
MTACGADEARQKGPLAWRRFTLTDLTTHLTTHACARRVPCPTDTLPAAERPSCAVVTRGLTGPVRTFDLRCAWTLQAGRSARRAARPARHAALAICATWRDACVRCDFCPTDTLPAAQRTKPVPWSPSRGLTGPVRTFDLCARHCRIIVLDCGPLCDKGAEVRR